MTEYLIFRGPRFFLRERRSLSAAWTVTLLFEDLEAKIVVMNHLQTRPAQRVRAALNSRVLCQACALLQKQAQLFQVLWLEVALCDSKRMQKETGLVPHKQFRLPDSETQKPLASQPFATEKGGQHQNCNCHAGLPKKIVAMLQKPVVETFERADVFPNGVAFGGILSLSGTPAHPQDARGGMACGKQQEEGMGASL